MNNIESEYKREYEALKAHRLNKYANKKGGNSATLNKPLVDTGFALQHISNREE